MDSVMQEYFDSEIKNLKREIIALKSSTTKSSGSVATVVKSVDFTIQLESTGSLRPSGQAAFKIALRDDALFDATLDKYYDDILKEVEGRYLTRYKYIDTAIRNGEKRIEIVAIGTSDDEATIRGGGSVSVSGTLTVKSTAEFTLEVI